MAGAGYKLFNTGDVLTAAQVNTYLQEQVVMVFANAAARTTALSGVLAEGMVSYLKDTDALEIYSGSAWVGYGSGDITAVTAGTGISGGGTSGAVTITNSMATEITAAGDIIVGTGSGTFDNLPIGTTGQVLTADTTVSPYKVKWATASSGGAYTLLTSGSLTGSSVTSATLSGSYTDLKIVVTQYQGGTDDTYLAIRFNGDSGTNYQSGGNNFNYNTTPNSTHIRTNVGVTNSGTSVSLGDIYIPSYSNSVTWKYATCWNVVKNTSGGAVGYGLYLGNWASTAAITSVTFFPNTGSFNNGAYSIYGVK